MALLASLGTGVTGLNDFQTSIDVIGNNIANVDTNGFKSSDVSFQDQISQLISGVTPPSGILGGTDPQQIGLGSSVANTTHDFTQGQLNITGQPSQMAVNGNGFFIIKTANGPQYTRAGNFTLDSNQNLVDPNGNFVQAFPAVAGVVNNSVAPTNLQIPVGNLSIARASANVTFGGNFNSSVPVGAAFGAAASSFNLGYQIYDSLGNAHNLTLTFTKEHVTAGGPDPAGGGTEWTYQLSTNDPTISGIAGPAFAADGDPAEPPAFSFLYGGANPFINGEVAFNTAGQMIVAGGETTGNGTPTYTFNFTNGAASGQNVALNLTAFTQLNGATTAATTNQDGLALGTLNNFTVGQNGTVTGQFTNGLTQALGQIALANFTNAGGLVDNGNNLYSQSANSGLAQVSQPQSGGTGAVIGGAVESSNVDLSKQFTQLIVSQRAFEANARTITASDTILTDLLQIVH